MAVEENTDEIRTYVREHYSQIAENQLEGRTNDCCSIDTDCCGQDIDLVLSDISGLYQVDLAELPEQVTNLSLGCGDPVTLASLEAGQIVLDMGSGGGIDCFLAAKHVGPSGHVIGVDMTPSMVDQARSNKSRLNANNVEFRLGEIEHLPVADKRVDVIISNCVINLSPDKPQVFREAFRVLKPGGRLAVSDILSNGPLPDEIRNNPSAWAGCVAGAVEAREYMDAIIAAGFVDVQVEPVHPEKDDLHKPTQKIFSARVTAFKPAS